MAREARSRRCFGLSQNTHFLAGLEIECEPLAALDPRFLHCFADSKIAPGYIAWAVPGVNGTQIGVAASRPHKPELVRAAQPHAHLVRPEATFALRERRSGLIPTGGMLRNIGMAA